LWRRRSFPTAVSSSIGRKAQAVLFTLVVVLAREEPGREKNEQASRWRHPFSLYHVGSRCGPSARQWRYCFFFPRLCPLSPCYSRIFVFPYFFHWHRCSKSLRKMESVHALDIIAYAICCYDLVRGSHRRMRNVCICFYERCRLYNNILQLKKQSNFIEINRFNLGVCKA
jgi:hypothetical protein